MSGDPNWRPIRFFAALLLATILGAPLSTAIIAFGAFFETPNWVLLADVGTLLQVMFLAILLGTFVSIGVAWFVYPLTWLGLSSATWFLCRLRQTRLVAYLAAGLAVGVLARLIMGDPAQLGSREDIVPPGFYAYFALIFPAVAAFVFWHVYRPDRAGP